MKYIFLLLILPSCILNGRIGRAKKPPTNDISFEKTEAFIKNYKKGSFDSLVVIKGAKKLTVAIPYSKQTDFFISSIGLSHKIKLLNRDSTQRLIFSVRDTSWKYSIKSRFR